MEIKIAHKKERCLEPKSPFYRIQIIQRQILHHITIFNGREDNDQILR